METIRITGDVFLGLNVVYGITVLVLQVAAYREHHHKSFLLLTLSTLMGFVALALMSAPRVAASLTPDFPALYIGSAVFFAVSASLGVWGVASLFRSYRELRNAA